MTPNVSQFTSAGIQQALWAANNANGYPMGPTGSIAQGADVGMSQLLGINSLNLNLQQPRRVSIPGDDGVKSIFLFEAVELPSGDLALGVFDGAFVSKSQGTLLSTDGDWSVPVLQPTLPTYASLTLITVSQAKSAASGSVGQAQYMVKIYPKVQSVPLADAGISNAAATSFTHALIANKFDRLPWGTPLSLVNNGTTEAAVYGPFSSEGRPQLHTHLANGTDDSFTLAQTPIAATANKIKVYRNGTLLTITTDWSISGAVITLVSPGSAGDVVIVRYEW